MAYIVLTINNYTKKPHTDNVIYPDNEAGVIGTMNLSSSVFSRLMLYKPEVIHCYLVWLLLFVKQHSYMAAMYSCNTITGSLVGVFSLL